MLLGELVAVSASVAATRSRKAKTHLLARALRAMGPDDLVVAVPFLLGEPRQGRVGIGGAALRDAIGASPPSERPILRLDEVDQAFSAIAASKGEGAARRRQALLGALLARATRDEQRFLAALAVGELRQGALEGVLLEAVALASGAALGEVRRATMAAGALAPVAATALREGAAALARYRLALFTPVGPMLAQTAEDVEGALASLGAEAALEHKLDGARVQVHRDGDLVRVYSRALRDVTPAVPEIVEAVRALPARRLVLDGETLALGSGGSPEPFQVTMQRFGRKLDVAAQRSRLPLSTAFFDVLHLDGDDLLALPARDRAVALASAVPVEARVHRVVTADPRVAAEFLADAIRRGHEGVMAKALDAPYEAGQRGAAWLKVKPAHTLDLVVLAAEWGHGRRAGLLSNLHLGARDAGSGGFAMLGKTFKGLTDAALAWQTERLRALAVAEDGFTVHVRPTLVVEVAFDGIQASPRYPAGMALRFARVRRYREDKQAEEADTVETVRRLFERGRGRGR